MPVLCAAVLLWAACGDSPTNPPPPTTGAIAVSVETTGSDLDPDGYILVVDGAGGTSVGATSGPTRFPDLQPGSHTVEITDIAANCSVAGQATRTVTVAAGRTISVDYSVNCAPRVGSIEVSVVTTGPDPDPDGYEVTLDGTDTRPLAVDGAVTFADVLPGSRTIELGGVAANCAADGGTSQTVAVSAEQTASAPFSVSCTAITGSITVVTVTTGFDLDAEYLVSVDGSAGETIGANARVELAGLPPGDHSVELENIQSNCVVSDPNPRTVSVTIGATVETRFEVSCASACGTIASLPVLDLAPGEDAVVTGSDLSCIQLPAHAAGAEYEVAVTPLPQTLGFSAMRLDVLGVPASGQVVGGSVSTLPPAAGVTAAEIEERKLAAQYAWDAQLRELEQPLLPQIRGATGGGFGLMAAPQLGDVRDFRFSCISQSQFPNAPSSVAAEVVSVSANAVIFEDTLARGSFTDPEYEAIAENFDQVIIPTETQYFGELTDVPGDIAPGQVVILYTPGVNRLTSDYRPGYIAGFFCPLDLGSASGNDAKMFYLVVPDPTGAYTPASGDGLGKETVLRSTDNTVAHELQHLINAKIGAGGAQDVWLNEGLSHLAEEIVGHATAQAAGVTELAPGLEIGPEDILQSQTSVDVFNKYYSPNWRNLGLYLASPADTAALLNSRDPGSPSTFRMRGTAWSFVRYLLDRAGAPATEWQLTRQLIADGSFDSRQAVANAFGASFNELAADWSAMFTAEDRADLGGPVRPGLTLTSYRVRDIYDDPSIGPVISFTGDYPLRPLVRDLAANAAVGLNLFTATAEYVTLSATAGSGGTGLRLLDPAGGTLSSAVAPHLVILRTK